MSTEHWQEMDAEKKKLERELDAEVIKAVYGFDVIWLTDYLGRSMYIWDRHAQREGTVHLIGGNWIKGRTDDGAEVEVFARGVPNFSRDWAAAGQLLGYLPWPFTLARDEQGQWRCDIELNGQPSAVNACGERGPMAIALAAVKAAKWTTHLKAAEAARESREKYVHPNCRCAPCPPPREEQGDEL